MRRGIFSLCMLCGIILLFSGSVFAEPDWDRRFGDSTSGRAFIVPEEGFGVVLYHDAPNDEVKTTFYESVVTLIEQSCTAGKKLVLVDQFDNDATAAVAFPRSSLLPREYINITFWVVPKDSPHIIVAYYPHSSSMLAKDRPIRNILDTSLIRHPDVQRNQLYAEHDTFLALQKPWGNYSDEEKVFVFTTMGWAACKLRFDQKNFEHRK